MDRLAGVFCAFWTPTDSKGEVLWSAMDAHLAFLAGAGVHGFMALGSTAEFPHLSLEQRKQILKRLIRTRMPVIANVSDVSHRNVLELSRHAREQGAMAAAILPPWFFSTSQRDLAEFFIAVGKESKFPIVLYNFPEMTGKKIELETIRQVAETVPVLGVKQSGGDFEYHHELFALGKKLGFAVMTGADTRLEETLHLGCAGTVSGLANAVPDVLRTVFENFEREEKSPRESEFLARLGDLINVVDFPLNVKAAIAARGLETGARKNPISRETERACDSLEVDLRKLFGSFGLEPARKN